MKGGRNSAETRRILRGNRFAVLAVDSDYDEEDPRLKKPQKYTKRTGVAEEPKPCVYSLLMGKQRIQLDRQEPFGMSVMPAPLQPMGSSVTTTSDAGSLNAVSFFGRCFQCQYMAHSQKYCPLRLCKSCREFGHSEIVCPRAKSGGVTMTAKGMHMTGGKVTYRRRLVSKMAAASMGSKKNDASSGTSSVSTTSATEGTTPANWA